MRLMASTTVRKVVALGNYLEEPTPAQNQQRYQKDTAITIIGFTANTLLPRSTLCQEDRWCALDPSLKQ